MPEEDRLERRNAFTCLKERVDVLAPWLASHTKRGQGGGPFSVLLWQYFLDQSELDPEPCLPYGIRAERFLRKPGCGEIESCGMSRIRLTDYRFLHFLTK